MAYRSPIEPLIPNILHLFENANPTALRMLKCASDDGKIDREIDLDMVPREPVGPNVTGQVGVAAKIRLHITQLEMLWAFTYGAFVLWEHQMRGAMLDQDQRPSGEPYSEDMLSRAAVLLKWAQGLRRSYSPWPKMAPSPTSSLDEETITVGKVSQIFVGAVGLMLHHEVCHAVQNHLQSGRTDEEIREQEREADEFAYRQFLCESSSENERRIKAWSMIAAPLSSLFLIDYPSQLRRPRHPHVHHRIDHALTRMDFAEQRNKDYFFGLGLFLIDRFIAYHEIREPDLDAQSEDNKFDDFNDLFQHYVDHLDTLLDGNGQ